MGTKDTEVKNPAYKYYPATKEGENLIVTSPHSGRKYPKDFSYNCDFEQLQRLEDRYVDRLIPKKLGVHVLKAEFPRSYIDPSRSLDCLDPRLVPGGLNNVPYKTDGDNQRFLKHKTGLIFLRSAINNFDIYAENNLPDETAILNRIPYWQKYHEKLSQLFNGITEKNMTAHHLDMHSCWRMNGKGTERRPDIALSDKDGTSCNADFLNVVRKAFEDQGLEVKVNNPFKGGYIIQQYGNPRANQHTIQVEIARDLYINEKTLEETEGLANVKKTIGYVIAQSMDYAQNNLN